MQTHLVPGIRLGVRIIVLAACATTHLGCGARRAPADTRPVIPRETVTTVLVRNHHGADLRIWVIGENGKSHRLGFAPRMGSTTMVIPRDVVLPARLTFVAIPMSHDDPQTSEPFVVDAGAKLVYTVAISPTASALARLP